RTERAVPDDRRAYRGLDRLVDAGRGNGVGRLDVDIRDAIDPRQISPDGARETVRFRNHRQREFNLAGDAGIHGRAGRFACGRQPRAELARLEAAHKCRPMLECLKWMYCTPQGIDDARLPTNAADDAGVLNDGEVVAGLG